MSDVIRFGLRGEFLSKLRATLPGVTLADLDVFDALVVRDCLLTDDGKPHPELVAWVEAILRRGDGGAVPAPVHPLPKMGPAGAEVVL
jgi:hypothetical protein